MKEGMGIDEGTFLDHIAGGSFQLGVEMGKWRLISIEWPKAIIAITAARRDQGPNEYFFLFDVANYPQSLPTAQPWDLNAGATLEPHKRPQGSLRVSKAFRSDWQNGQALYLPCDRLSIQGHEGWHNQHPEMIWSRDGDITQYLRIIYELLNSEDYSGCLCT